MNAAWLMWAVLVAPAAAVDADPIRCWWQTSAGAVTIGESFTATLTCAVREQDSLRTVPDESRLAAAVIPLAPFEVLGGAHPGDLRSASHRFVQYDYTLRIIDRDVIGHDASFPDVHIPYRVQTLTNGEWSAGRDRTYTIPGQTIRVLSLVPAGARDIRDGGDASFSRVTTLRTRARGFQVAAYALVLLGVLAATPAVLGLVRRRVTTATPTQLPARAVLRAVNRELTAIAQESTRGWTGDLVARALHALRLAAAVGLGRQPAARPHGETPRPDQLVVTDGWRRQRQVAVSSAVTARDLTQALAALPADTPAPRRQALERLAASMTTLSRVLYREAFQVDQSVDDAFAEGRAAVGRILP